MVLKKLGSILQKKPQAVVEQPIPDDVDTPEANAVRGTRLFCESGPENAGDEVLHLPTIVEAAVASPSAATAAAQQIRRYLSKDNISRPHVQYNAIMLVRILADNPGPSFTKNFDKAFVDTVKQLLRRSQDPSVRQILIETLNALEREKAYDTNMNDLFAMWRKEQGLGAHAPSSFGSRKLNAPPWDPNQAHANGGHSRGHRSSSKTLPAPAELAARVEEARTTAKLLLQLVQSTPSAELFGNDLIKEFAGRCQSAQRSIQGYINCDNPAPDDETMLTLIETNEQLSLAASKHQRAVLQARRALGTSNTPSPPPPNASGGIASPPGPPPPESSTGVPSLPAIPSSFNTLSPGKEGDTTRDLTRSDNDDPFSDDNETYAPPSGPPPPPRRPAPADNNESYSSTLATPGLMARQESAVLHHTMRGANSPPAPEVSPIETRAPVTYRY